MSYTTNINYNYGGAATYYPPAPVPSAPVYPIMSAPSYQLQNPYYLVGGQPKPVVTRAAYDQTLKLLNKAAEVSVSILGGNTNTPASSYYYQSVQAAPVVAAPAAPSTWNFDFSDRSWKMFNTETHHHHHYHNGNESEEKKDDTGTRILVGLIGLVVAGAAAFFIGKALAEGDDQAEENMSFAELKGQWNNNKTSFDPDYKTTVDSIIVRADVILERQETSRTHKIALLVFGLAAGGTAVAGALIGSSVVMLVAGGIGACVTVAALLKLGYALFSSRDQKDAQAIEAGLDELRQKQIVVI